MGTSNTSYKPHFAEFLHNVENAEAGFFATNTTINGVNTLQQTRRNNLRKEGVAALKADLEHWYGDDFDIVETKEGLVIVAENEADGFTFSWELKNTIKSLDYDPFIEAGKYEDAVKAKAEKKRAREAAEAAKAALIEEKRAKKLAEVAAAASVKALDI